METAEKHEDPGAARGGECSHPPSSRCVQWRGFLLHVFTVLVFALMIPATLFAQDEFGSLYDKACLSFRQAQYDDALKYYKKANRLRENSDPECLWGMAQIYSKLGAYKNTLDTCDRLIAASGDDLYYAVKAWNLRGNELSAVATEKPGDIDEKKLQEAEAAFREVLKLSGASMAHYNLGITLIRLDRIEEGVRELQIYTRDPDTEELAEKAQKIIEEPRRAVENFAPDFSFVTADGEYVDFTDLKGKIVLVDFWGAWCKPCRDAIPFLSKLVKKHGEEEFALISVDANDDESKWREFIVENKMDWIHTRDGDRKIQGLFQVMAFPTYFLIDHEGIIRYRGIGSTMQTEDEIFREIKKALKDQAAYRKQPKDSSDEKVIKLLAGSSEEKPIGVGRMNLSEGNSKSGGSLPTTEKKRVFSFRIPEPLLEVTREEPPNMPSDVRNQTAFYRVRVLNWASVPDDLFETAKGLMACSSGSIVSKLNPSTPKRLEIIIKSESGTVLRSFCDPPQPQILNSLMLTIPIQSRPGKIYLTLKDRLTGTSVQSELVSLP